MRKCLALVCVMFLTVGLVVAADGNLGRVDPANENAVEGGKGMSKGGAGKGGMGKGGAGKGGAGKGGAGKGGAGKGGMGKGGAGKGND